MPYNPTIFSPPPIAPSPGNIASLVKALQSPGSNGGFEVGNPGSQQPIMPARGMDLSGLGNIGAGITASVQNRRYDETVQARYDYLLKQGLSPEQASAFSRDENAFNDYAKNLYPGAMAPGTLQWGATGYKDPDTQVPVFANHDTRTGRMYDPQGNEIDPTGKVVGPGFSSSPFTPGRGIGVSTTTPNASTATVTTPPTNSPQPPAAVATAPVSTAVPNGTPVPTPPAGAAPSTPLVTQPAPPAINGSPTTGGAPTTAAGPILLPPVAMQALGPAPPPPMTADQYNAQVAQITKIVDRTQRDAALNTLRTQQDGLQKDWEGYQSKVKAAKQNIDTSGQQFTDITRTLDMVGADPGLMGPNYGFWHLVGGSKSYDLAQVLSGIKANLSLQNLQRMKDQSSSGASGLGSLSEGERQMLSDLAGSLDPISPQVFMFNLARMQALVAKSLGAPAPPLVDKSGKQIPTDKIDLLIQLGGNGMDDFDKVFGTGTAARVLSSPDLVPKMLERYSKGQTAQPPQTTEATPVPSAPGALSFVSSATAAEAKPPEAPMPAPSAAAPVPTDLPRVLSEEGYNTLPDGTQYFDPDGKVRTKGGAATETSTPAAQPAASGNPFQSGTPETVDGLVGDMTALLKRKGFPDDQINSYIEQSFKPALNYPRVYSQEGFNQLPSGSRYIGPDGNIWTKP